MEKNTVMAAMMAAAVLGTAGAALAAPEVSNVSMEQITGTRQVKITYNLTNEAAIITLSIETNGVAIPDSAVTRLTGAVCKEVAIGTGHTIMWNAGADWPENITATAKARVTAWSVDAPPQYCAVDVIEGSSASLYPVYYYLSAEGVPGGVTNALYKTTQILMRKLPSTDGTFKMGSPADETGRNADREEQVNVSHSPLLLRSNTTAYRPHPTSYISHLTIGGEADPCATGSVASV